MGQSGTGKSSLWNHLAWLHASAPGIIIMIIIIIIIKVFIWC